MAAIVDAWTLVFDEFRAQRKLEKKRREYKALTSRTLDYPLLEAITQAAAKQQPGFYSIIRFPEGATWEFGVKEGTKPQPRRNPDETF